MAKCGPLRFSVLASLAILGVLSSVTTAWARGAPAVARVQERTISLEQIDVAGGRSLYDAAEQLYEARVRALYQLLSTDLVEREARAQHVTADQLLERRVNAHVTPVTPAEVNAFIQSQPESAAADPRARKDAEVYLNLKRHGDAKRDFLNELFKKYQVRVMLEEPPPPPAETIPGPLEPSIGSATAPVTVVVFSDYLCPYCRDLSHTLDTLLEKDPQSVRVVYRSYPVHDHADVMAQAALCAADQGHFAQYHRMLFEKEAELNDLPVMAQRAGLDVSKFNECLNSGRYKARVDEDMQAGQGLKIQGTPTLFVNGQRLRGAQPLARMTTQIEAAKRQAQAPSAVARQDGAHGVSR